MKTSQSKKSNPKTKGSVLNAFLVLKNFLKQKPNPQHHKINTTKKEKRNQQRETLYWKEEKGLEVDHVVKIDREIPFIEHIYRSIYAPFLIELVGE
ncbi:hypothetical protein HpCK98_11920 [Helicobacter pylori]